MRTACRSCLESRIRPPSRASDAWGRARRWSDYYCFCWRCVCDFLDLPGLESLRLVLVLLVATGIVFAGSMRQVEFFQHPTSRWMLVFGLAILWSLPFSYWPGETGGAVIDFAKQLYVYVLIINLATSLPALTAVSGVMVFSAAVHGGIAIEKFIAMGGGGGEDRRIEGVGASSATPTTSHFRSWR